MAPKLGDIMYADLDDNGNITPEDRDIIGNPFPKYSYSFNLGASWKNFYLSTFWQGVGGIYATVGRLLPTFGVTLPNRWVGTVIRLDNNQRSHACIRKHHERFLFFILA